MSSSVVLAIEHKVCGFSSAEDVRYLRAIIICCMPSFGGEVKLSDPVIFYSMLKIPL
jgi:hypothetical protein